jgi:hypothetical protein
MQQEGERRRERRRRRRKKKRRRSRKRKGKEEEEISRYSFHSPLESVAGRRGTRRLTAQHAGREK